MDFADKLDMMDDDCDIQGFPNGNDKLPDLTPLEAAEKLEHEATVLDAAHYFQNSDTAEYSVKLADALCLAASFLRAIAAGEYKRVVRCYECRHWMLYRDPETGNPCLDGHCDRWHGDRRREGFCDQGERKDGDPDA